MADDKKSTGQNAVNTTDVDVDELVVKIREEVKAEMKAEEEKKAAARCETEEQAKRSNQKVSYILPLIDGEPEEVNVTINGKTWQILRGEEVKIPRMVAEILDNQRAQQNFFRKYKKEKTEQVAYVEHL